MNSATGPALILPRTADRQRRGLWFYYRNARMWGKPIIWSARYAREATVKFS